MRQVVLSLENQATLVQYPDSLHGALQALLPGEFKAGAAPSSTIIVEDDGERYSLRSNGQAALGDLDQASCLYALFGEIGHSLVDKLSVGVALHAAAVSNGGAGIVIPGSSGAGKSSLTAWFVDRGFKYLTDEIVVFGDKVPCFSAFGRPLIIRERARESIARLPSFASAPWISADTTSMILPQSRGRLPKHHTCRLIVFPTFAEGEALTIEPLTPAQAGLELMASNINARNLANHGFDTITEVARAVPAVTLRYGSFEVLDGAFDALVELVLSNDWNSTSFAKLFRAFGGTNHSRHGERQTTQVEASGPVPAPTPRGARKKLTVGMATYDDYDGVYFSLQALRMYHPEILDETEFVIVDNHPNGRCAEPLKQLEGYVANYRYIPYGTRSGTATREVVFAESNAELVLCMDCHVFVVPGAVKKLIAYCDAHPNSRDLLQGPLVYDDLDQFSSHFAPEWREGMYGCWASDDRARDPCAEPFEIPMQGLGLFACRRSAWPGFNPMFRGFGGEEGYLHEKFRQAGGRTLCLPFLRWMHRFHRPAGVPYVNTWNDRLRNYMIGFHEVGWERRAVEEHFCQLLGPAVAGPIVRWVNDEIAQLDQGTASLDGSRQESADDVPTLSAV